MRWPKHQGQMRKARLLAEKVPLGEKAHLLPEKTQPLAESAQPCCCGGGGRRVLRFGEWSYGAGRVMMVPLSSITRRTPIL